MENKFKFQSSKFYIIQNTYYVLMQEETLKNVVEELQKNYGIELDSKSGSQIFYNGKCIALEEDLGKFHNGNLKEYILQTLDSSLSLQEKHIIRKRRYNAAIITFANSMIGNGEKQMQINDFKRKAEAILIAGKYSLSELHKYDQALDTLVDDPALIDEDDFVIPPAVSENYN